MKTHRAAGDVPAAGAMRQGLEEGKVASRRLVRLLVLAVLTLVACAVPAVVLGAPPFTLPDDITTAASRYHIHHSVSTTGNPQTGATTGVNPHFLPAAQAQRMADALSNGNAVTTATPNGYHNGYVDRGFLAPDYGGGNRDVYAWNCTGCDSGNAPANEINMPVGIYATATEPCLRAVLGHESFHHVQYAYVTFGRWSTWGNDPIEGAARAMQDKLYGDLDAQGTTGCPGDYVSQINGYLGGGRSSTLFGQSYGFALFWNYLMERFGTDRTEPHVGTDFMRRFWENAQKAGAFVDFPGTLRTTIHDFDTDASLEDVFHDFTIANVTKDLDVTPLPDGLRYRYVDEQPPNTSTYGSVSMDDSRTVTATTGDIPVKDVQRYSARYLDAKFGPDCQVIGFRADGDRLGYALAAVSGKRVVRLDKAVAEHFKRGLITRHPGDVEGVANRLIAVVTGLENGGSSTAKWVCGQAALTIVEPTTAQPVIVGEKGKPGRFIVRVRVSGPSELGSPSIEGLRASDFNAWVGSQTNGDKAPIVSSSYVQGEYWLVVQAPTKPSSAADLEDLIVQLAATNTQTQPLSVRYGVKALDQMVVIDRSGSMAGPASAPKIEAARAAGGLYVDAASDTDKLGVVSFSGDDLEPNDDATLDALLQPMGPVGRAKAKSATQAVVADGFTSIGDGVKKAVDEFAIRGTPTNEHRAVLLSDGMENEAAFWSGVAAAVKAAGIKIDTIALGPDSDQVLLQKIASDTGGTYKYVEVSATAQMGLRLFGPAFAPIAQSFGLHNRLADAFLLASESAQDQERLWEHTGTLAGGASADLPIMVREDKITSPEISVSWTSPSGRLDPTLTDASGTPIPSFSRIDDATHVVLRGPDLPRGTYRLHLASSGTPGAYLAVLAGRQQFGARLDLRVGDPVRDPDFGDAYLRGLPVRIVSTLSDVKGPITGADVFANVTHPDGSTIRLRLLDDGAHGDGEPGDGVYANSYTRTTVATLSGLGDKPGVGNNGSYQVVVDARGGDNLGGTFARVGKTSFAVTERRFPAPDADQDGMPDRYEALHPCLTPATVDDSGTDPDGDGLRSKAEYLAGTDPCSVDTDLGGEPDSSELKNGRNPFDPVDDALPRPIDPSVIVGPFDHIPNPGVVPNANLIRFPASPQYVKVRLYRSTNPTGPFAKVTDILVKTAKGRYRDKGLVNGTTYYYEVAGVNANGVESVRSPVFKGTPRKQPNLPSVDLMINDWRPLTNSPKVRLRLVAPATVNAMQVSNRPSFAGAVWRKFSTTSPWTLEVASGPATVYVRVRDASGNVSAPAAGTINVASGLGQVSGTLKPDRKPKVDLSGIMVWSTDHPEVPPVVVDASGNFRFVDLPPGTYRLTAVGGGFVARKPVTVTVQPSTTAKVTIGLHCQTKGTGRCAP